MLKDANNAYNGHHVTGVRHRALVSITTDARNINVAHMVSECQSPLCEL